MTFSAFSSSRASSIRLVFFASAADIDHDGKFTSTSRTSILSCNSLSINSSRLSAAYLSCACLCPRVASVAVKLIEPRNRPWRRTHPRAASATRSIQASSALQRTNTEPLSSSLICQLAPHANHLTRCFHFTNSDDLVNCPALLIGIN